MCPGRQHDVGTNQSQPRNHKHGIASHLQLHAVRCRNVLLQNEKRNFLTHTIRTTILAGNPWFDARGVCSALGMSLHSGTSVWLQGLSQDEKRLVWRREVPKLFLGSRAASVNLISESGLYKLVMRSDKPEAREFQDWVARVVLPAIRKDGAYVMGEEKVATGELTGEELAVKASEVLASFLRLYYTPRVCMPKIGLAARAECAISSENRLLSLP